MPAALSMDLRWRIVKKSVMYEMVASSIADQLDVPLVTVRKVLRRWRETGSVETHQGRRLKDPANTIMTHEQCMRLLELVTLLDDEVMLDEIHMHFCVYAGLELSVATICRAMHKLGFTRKRLHRLALATSGGPRAARTSGREAKCARTSGRKVKRRVPSEPPGADGEQQQQASSKKKKRRSAKSVAEEDAARANLPEISLGARCWHRQAKEWVTIAKVYWDDLPPYYSVTMADGSERATVRARLDTQEEREEALAADARRVAEEKAEAAAAALLAEEAKQPRRKPTSEGRGSSKAKRR